MPTDSAWMPLFVDLTKRRIIIVGGGRIATRKAAKLPSGCRWTVIAPDATAALQERIRRDGGHWEARAFRAEDIAAGDLVIGAVADDAVRQEVAAAAARVGAWYNDASDVTQGDVLLPAAGSWGSLTWVLGSGGASPRLMKLIRADWDSRYSVLGDVAAYLSHRRDTVKTLLPTQAERERFWRTYLPDDTLARVRRGEWEELKGEIEDAIGRLRLKS